MESRQFRGYPTLFISPRAYTKYFISSLEALIKENKKYNFKEDNYLFVNVKTGEKYQLDAFRKALKKYSEIAGLESTLSPHMFRHYFATSYIKNGGDIFELKELLNHKNVQTTIRYVTSNKEHIKNSHLKYSPINQIT
ncbi:tyrosine-type recombinase/integrase [Tepidibacillus infernus]|uniref:tyrosine-type recombinase/integrase n=1 Tax=Tepidibacillus infernus TaxID=1806172 RepID=UPI003B693A60